MHHVLLHNHLLGLLGLLITFGLGLSSLFSLSSLSIVESFGLLAILGSGLASGILLRSGDLPSGEPLQEAVGVVQVHEGAAFVVILPEQPDTFVIGLDHVVFENQGVGGQLELHAHLQQRPDVDAMVVELAAE